VDLRKIGFEALDSSHLAEDRDQCWAFVKL
jgi:hypothetical protein